MNKGIKITIRSLVSNFWSDFDFSGDNFGLNDWSLFENFRDNFDLGDFFDCDCLFGDDFN